MCRSTTLPDNLAATGSELVGAKMGVLGVLILIVLCLCLCFSCCARSMFVWSEMVSAVGVNKVHVVDLKKQTLPVTLQFLHFP